MRFTNKLSYGFTLFLLLSACGVSQNEPPKDDPLERTMNVAKQGVYYNRLKQAEINYKKSYQYALTRDDRDDIKNAGYNLAVVQLDMNQLQQAYDTIRKVHNDLYIRNDDNSPELDLVEAAILYRLHRENDALRLLQNAEKTNQDDIQERAYFFMGLIAKDQNNLSLLVENSQKLDQIFKNNKKAYKEESWKADQGELHAWLAYKNGKYDEAITTAQYVEVNRRQQIEYRAMVRALVIQAMANRAKGNAKQAANLLLRAGKSSALLKDYSDAKSYLSQVMNLHSDELTYNLASQELVSIVQIELKEKNK